MVLLWSFADMCRAVKNLNHWTHGFSAEVEQGDVLFLFQLSYYKQCLLYGLFTAVFSAFLSFWLAMLPFKMAPKHSADVLSSVGKGERAVMCFTEKLSMCEVKSCSGVLWCC